MDHFRRYVGMMYVHRILGMNMLFEILICPSYRAPKTCIPSMDRQSSNESSNRMNRIESINRINQQSQKYSKHFSTPVVLL
jgi:hypothetical protein